MRELKDRVAVVTGAASGIGRAIALELARHGMDLVLADVDLAGLAPVAVEIAALGRRAHRVQTDVRQLSALEHLLAETLATFGGCHVMVNNAGVFHASGLLASPATQWQRVVDTNVWGVIHGCRVFGAHFAAQKLGHIVNTASAAGLLPVPGQSSYSTTKFAVVGLSQQLRWELAVDGVGVTVLCPGIVKTNIAKAEGVGLEHLDREAMMAKAPAPEGLARKTVQAIQRDRGMVRYGAEAWLFSFLRLLPAWLIDPFGRFMARMSVRVLRGDFPPPAAKPSKR